jgi:D-glycero-D-manno-heptose 1,7-bisphosphate phosphatase
MKKKAAFLDRDGVLNEDREYVYRVEDFEFIPGSVGALRALQEAGYLLVIVTNQSGIARGRYSESDYHELEAYMRKRLSDSGVSLDCAQYCPHLPDADIAQYRSDCECRKPRPGMIQAATGLLDIDPAQSILVGDRRADLEAGRAAGVARCFLVRSGRPLSDSDLPLADGVYDDLAQCVAELIRFSPLRGSSSR